MQRSHATLFAALVGAASILVPGCGGLPRAPAFPSANDGFQAVDATPPGMDSDPAVPLSLHPGDRVNLRLESAEINTVDGLTVDERGMLHVPLVGDVQVAGLPLAEADQRIEQGMRPFDATVRVTVLLADPQGQLASVIGAVGDQGRYPVTPGMRVADLLALAGGPAQDETGVLTADLPLARLVREGSALPISVALALTGDPRHNVHVRAGDHLYVPPQRSGIISVLGQVTGATTVAYQDGIRLSQALAMAGGHTRDANGGDIRIVRGPSDHPQVYRAAIDHIAAGEDPDPVLAPGDIVYVGSSALADFRDVMNAISPIISVGATTAVGVIAAQP
ncbi:MAG: SLBB domain-containing protein [Myxococcales bacterium]|nr:SLBB domain-containing protein [Myxococcales bacterium]